MDSEITIKVYHGFGHAGNCTVYGHVLAGKAAVRHKYTRNILTNIIQLIKLFFVHPLPGRKVQLTWQNRQYESVTEKDGFFKFNFIPGEKLAAGWHTVTVQLINGTDEAASKADGSFYVPHATQYAFVSDIDDTVLISHSATRLKRLVLLLTKNPRRRKAFADVVTHYQLLSRSHTNPATPNPFFYVSSSEWNLYDDLKEFFRHNGFPEGVFLLSEIKNWYQLLQTGKTKHGGKLLRIVRLLEAFPLQKFVLFGDNSQSDPEIYSVIANRYPQNITAIYIRNIHTRHLVRSEEWMTAINNKSIHTFIFESNDEAIGHSRKIGLI
ncbi:MAG: phosphatase domain-containing protein [Ferruginibacter sp.]